MTTEFVPCIIIHTGAFDVPQKFRELYIKAAKDAVKVGYKVLMEGGSAIESVETAVNCMEDNGALNCGFGSVLTEEGTVEMDAFIMEGHTMNVGAVCSVAHVANPVSLALRVMRDTPHCCMSGEGAEKFAKKIGHPLVDQKQLISEVAKEKTMTAKKYTNGLVKAGLVDEGSEKSIDHDTVGAVALDKHGHLACATSTGGLVAKMMGRVGDVPFSGSGGYANDVAAVSTTGHGEAILRTCLARQAVYNVENSLEVMVASQEAIDYMFNKVEGRGGLIMIDKEGRIGHAFNSPKMGWASLKDGQLEWGMNPSEVNQEVYEP